MGTKISRVNWRVISVIGLYTATAAPLFANDYTVATMAPPNVNYFPGNGFAIFGSSTRSNFFVGNFTNALPGNAGGLVLLDRPGLWQSTVYFSLSLPAGDNVNGDAGAVNSSGIVVGSVLINYLFSTPTMWVNGNYQYLPLDGESSGVATGINDAGLVVGYVAFADDHHEAAIWQNGGLTVLGTFGRANSNVSTLNNSGAIAISAYGTPDETHDAGILQNGIYTPITFPSAASVIIRDLNDNGTALLHVIMPDGTSSDQLRYEDGTFVPLPLLAGSVSEIPLHLNNSDQVVGTSSDAEGTQLIPTLWENGQVIDIRSFLPNASDYRNWGFPVINDDGAIVVGAALNNAPGVPTYLLFTPDAGDLSAIPEPASLVLLSIGGLALLKRHPPRHHHSRMNRFRASLDQSICK